MAKLLKPALNLCFDGLCFAEVNLEKPERRLSHVADKVFVVVDRLLNQNKEIKTFKVA